jgi:tetratricopeptide (TPR) repeat protein
MEQRDNPVHDWIPSLPPNLVTAFEGSSQGEMQEQLTRLHQRIREYERRFGIDTGPSLTSSPVDIVKQFARFAEDNNLPSDVLRQAGEAVKNGDTAGFLAVVRKVLERPIRLTTRQYRILTAYAASLGLDAVKGAILDHSRELHPADAELREAQLAHFAHSDDPGDRERARNDILRDLHISLEDDAIQIPQSFDQQGFNLLGLMLDAYYTDGLQEQALRITEAFLKRFPDSTKIVRNHARALENVGRGDIALEYYQKAIWCPDVDDTSAIWFGVELHNRNRHVDAVEAYLLACILDPEDAAGFTHVADDLSWAIQDRESRAMRTWIRSKPSDGWRNLPDGISSETIYQALAAAFSCRAFTQRERDRCIEVAEREQIDINGVMNAGMSLSARRSFASNLYDVLRTRLTDQRQVEKLGT